MESLSKNLKSKPKSAHDIGDPSLLSKKVIEDEKITKKSKKNISEESESEEDVDLKRKGESVKIDDIKSKLEKKAAEMASKSNESSKSEVFNKKPSMSQEESKRLVQ